MGIIGAFLIICFFIGLFNLVARILFGIGWCAWQLFKVLGVVIIILLILAVIGNHM